MFLSYVNLIYCTPGAKESLPMTNKRNDTFVILSAISIILILLGHLDFPLLTVGGLFPYYSFHVMLFPFISGYFYKQKEEEQIGAYLKRKALHLLLPYCIWNVIYGIFATILHNFGMGIGEDISLYNLTIAPFLSGHQFMYQAASWFVPALFLLELCNVIGRKVLSLIRIRNEYVIMALYLFVGLAAIFLAKRGSVYDYYKLPARIMLLAPCFQFGHLYKEKLERKDTLPSSVYFLIILTLQLIITLTTYGQTAYSAVWVTGFAHSIFLPYLTTFTGIAFWLRIAKVLTPVLKESRFVQYLGTHTFSVMMHHLLGFFLLNCLFAGLSDIVMQNGISALSQWLEGFDRAKFASDIYYVFLPNGMGEAKWLYLAAGLVISLAIARLIDVSKEKISKK